VDATAPTQPGRWARCAADPLHIGSMQQCVLHREGRQRQALGYFYFEEEPRRRPAAKLLTKRRGAADGGELRQLPKLLRRPFLARL